MENRAKAEDEIKRPSSTRLLRKPFYAYWTIRKTFKNELWPGSTRCPARSAISRVQIPVEKQPWQLRTKVGTFCNLLDICSLGTEYLRRRDPARYRRLFGTLPRFPYQSLSGRRALVEGFIKDIEKKKLKPRLEW